MGHEKKLHSRGSCWLAANSALLPLLHGCATLRTPTPMRLLPPHFRVDRVSEQRLKHGGLDRVVRGKIQDFVCRMNMCETYERS